MTAIRAFEREQRTLPAMSIVDPSEEPGDTDRPKADLRNPAHRTAILRRMTMIINDPRVSPETRSKAERSFELISALNSARTPNAFPAAPPSEPAAVRPKLSLKIPAERRELIRIMTIGMNDERQPPELRARAARLVKIATAMERRGSQEMKTMPKPTVTPFRFESYIGPAIAAAL